MVDDIPTEFRAIYNAFKTHTLTAEIQYLTSLFIAKLARSVPGVVVECGTWKGGMIAGIAGVMGPGRKYVLLDSFKGLPTAQPLDGDRAIEWQKNNDYKATMEDVHRVMSIAGAKNYDVHPGWFCDTLPTVPREQIALLRIDCNWYDSTKLCLERFYDHVAPGGLIVFNDYYVWDGSALAVHEFLAKYSCPERLRMVNDVCHTVKRR